MPQAEKFGNSFVLEAHLSKEVKDQITQAVSMSIILLARIEHEHAFNLILYSWCIILLSIFGTVDAINKELVETTYT